MKKIAFGCLGILTLIGVIIGFVFFLTAGLPKSADHFFVLIKENKIAEAYKSTALDFQSNTSYEKFQTFIGKYSLDKYESSFWNSRNINNNFGQLIGTVTTKDKIDIPIQIDFIKEKNVWKILYLKPSKSGIDENNNQNTHDKLPLPSDQDMTKLVQSTMSLTVQAIDSKDFSIFYENISEAWKAQTTPEQIKDAFHVYIDKKIDISTVTGLNPVFNEKPSIDEKGFLNLNGSYPLKKGKVVFKLGYIYEYPQWKLATIDVAS